MFGLHCIVAQPCGRLLHESTSRLTKGEYIFRNTINTLSLIDGFIGRDAPGPNPNSFGMVSVVRTSFRAPSPLVARSYTKIPSSAPMQLKRLLEHSRTRSVTMLQHLEVRSVHT